MSQRDVERTLGRLLTDQGFRNGFFLDPAHACSQVGIHLTSREFEALFRVPRAAFASLGARLDDRVCGSMSNKARSRGRAGDGGWKGDLGALSDAKR